VSDVALSTHTSVMRKVVRQVSPCALELVGVLLVSLLSVPLALLAPLPLKVAVDSVIGSAPLPASVSRWLPASVAGSWSATLTLAVALLLAVAVLTQLQSLAYWVVSTYVGDRLVVQFRARLFAYLQRLSLSYHDTSGTADSVFRVQYDALSIRFIAVDSAVPLATSFLMLVSMVWVTARIDLQLAVVALLVCPVLVLLARLYHRHLRERWRAVKAMESSALSVVQEVLSAVRVVSAFGQEEREKARFVERSTRRFWAELNVIVLEGGFGLLVGVATAAGTAAVLYLGVEHVRARTLTVGELLLVIGYLVQLYEPLRTIGKTSATLQGSFAGAERAFELLDERPAVAEAAHPIPLDRARGAVTFQDVSFAYLANQPVLRGVSWEVHPGSRVGIAGHTGAGKTTLVSLLMRFYDPTAGRILLDGRDLRDYRLADLRNQFAMVLQEPILFSTTIAENIAYGRPGASEAELVEAARAANAHEFISRLPAGYDTVVGERGMLLSGGERQRVSLARAFLKDAPLLILDEPTSSVDVRTEERIFEAMERLMRDRTTFMIAHRLGTLACCDVRLELEHGRIVGGGRPGIRARPAR